MTFFITDTEVDSLLEVASRNMQMPNGTMRSFTGFKLMWKALNFLIVIGRWTRVELIDVALRMQTADDVRVAGLLPKAHGQPAPVSKLQIEMLKSPRVDPEAIRPVTTGENGPRFSLDESLHNVVSCLYRDLQQRLG